MRIPLCWCALAAALFASRVFASACITDTLADYELLGVGGCTVNDEPAFSFTFSTPVVSGGATALTASQIEVTPSFTSFSYTFTFSSVPTNGFSVSSGQEVEYEINFTWDPVVVRAEDDLDPGVATLSTSLCLGALFSASCSGGTTGSLSVTNSGTDDIFFSPVTTVDTQTLLTLNGTSGGVSIGTFAESVFPSPEPGSLVLAATGFLGVLWVALSRRRDLRR